MPQPSTDDTEPGDQPKRRFPLSKGEIAALGGPLVVVGALSDTQQLVQTLTGQGAAPLTWGGGALLTLTVIVLLLKRAGGRSSSNAPRRPSQSYG